MTNREIAALAIRLLGIYLIVVGLIQLASTIFQVTIPPPRDMPWLRDPIVITMGIVIACALPIAGILLLRLAPQLARRWLPDVRDQHTVSGIFAPGAALLGVYFVVRGLVTSAMPLERMVSSNSLESYYITQLAQALIYVIAGFLLIARPRVLERGISSVQQPSQSP